MKSGIQYKQGEIILVPFPYTNLVDIKQRPALVLSKNEDNERKEDLIVCAITSQLKESTESILITTENLEKWALPKQSAIKVSKIFSLDKNIIRKSFGKINEATLEEVKEEFYRLV